MSGLSTRRFAFEAFLPTDKKEREEVLKEIKESLTSEDDEEDSSTSTLKDYYMDNVIELVADQVVDEVGTNFTQQLYEQMKRNYNIE